MLRLRLLVALLVIATACSPRASTGDPDVPTIAADAADAVVPPDVSAPIDAPVDEEVGAPDVPAPIDAPTDLPVDAPVDLPVDAPVDVPVVDASGPCPVISIGSRVGTAVATGDTTGRRSVSDSSCGAVGSVRGGVDRGEVAVLWVAPASDVYTFQTSAAEFDTILSVREGGCSAREVACNDNLSTVNLGSRLTLPVPAGRALTLVVDGRDEGVFRLDILPSGGANCPRDWAVCGGRCVDTLNDPADCGGCGARCAAGQLCADGRCTTRTAACGNANLVVPCGAGFCPANSACVSDTRCSCRAGYVPTDCTNVPCGATNCTSAPYWCVPTLCAPRCEARECGPDNCNGSCGTCPSGRYCNAAGRCEVNADPCRGVPTGGVCTGATTLDVCAVPSGASEPMVSSYACRTNERCVMAAGVARCVLQTECAEGSSRCEATTLARCTGGRWVRTACPVACSATATGAQCAASVGSRTLTGRLQFQYRAPNATRSAWSPTLPVARAQSVLVVALRGTDVVGSAVTGEGATAGAFSVRVPDPPAASDTLVFVALRTDDRGGARYAVLDPALSTTTLPADCTDALPGRRECTPGVTRSDAPRVWSLSTPLTSVPVDGTVTVPVASAAGLWVFEQLRAAYAQSAARYLRDGLSLAAWLQPGITWTCGHCFYGAPPRTSPAGFTFASQMFIGGGAEEAWWSDAVLQHELGHWVMESFGATPGEGGPHYAGVPTMPGQAWSEGWATFHSASLRSDPILYSNSGFVSGGTLATGMYWFDIDRRAVSDSRVAWTRPTPGAGLLQRMDENEVAAMLWRLGRTARGADPVHRALASERVALPRRESPGFERGYTRRQWELDATTRTIIESSVRDTGVAAPTFADMLDALRCTGGFSAAEVDAVTEPTRAYPYPSAAPICRPYSGPPLSLGWSSITARREGYDTLVTLVAEVDAHGPFAYPLTFTLDLPPGATLVAGAAQSTTGPLAAGESVRREWTVRYTQTPATDAVLKVDGAGSAMGFHGAAPYRFGRAEPTPIATPVTGPSLRYDGHDLGASRSM